MGKNRPSPDQADLFGLAAPLDPPGSAAEAVALTPCPAYPPTAAPSQRAMPRERPRSRPRAEAEVPLKMISVTSALLRYGIGRTKFYQLVGRGYLKTVKLGSKTLVDVKSGDAFFDALPSRAPSQTERH